jgi:hypothetical protein
MLVKNLDLDNMKKLKSNFTTTEQSKRLLELGVPEWTADCCFSTSKYGDYICEGDKHIIPDDLCIQYVPFSAYPCWSVGRLMEIYLICNEVTDNVTKLRHSAIKVDVREFNIVEYMIRKLSNKVKKNKSFFSKLEEYYESKV